jgi:two-component system CheB/CheR fusion protein
MSSRRHSKALEQSLEGVAKRALVVAVGASSGGLEAFSQLLTAVPANSGLAFVLIQHLDRNHRSSLAEILASSTAMPVKIAEQGVEVAPNNVYVIPPDADLTIAERRLQLEPRGDKSSAHYPIDHFFQSLANDLGPLSVGIVLSGSGSDGAQGVRAIKAAYGITFAQEESSASFAAMPHNAVATGAIDFVLKPGDMAEALLKLSSGLTPPADSDDIADSNFLIAEDANLKTIFALIQKTTKIDFTHYKRTTLSRRIGRRMAIHEFKSILDYERFLEKNPSEIVKLCQEILINVTSFFREPASFEQLIDNWKEKIKDRRPQGPIRAWVAGCSTGEEVYSVAICLTELFAGGEGKAPVQIFATDINETALEFARSGIYPQSIVNDISAARLARFFISTDRGYQVNKSLRECCIFARHDLAKDPPFSRLDLVSCRNVLIYMDVVLQKRIIPMFHYSLKPGGFLLLGSAEALAGNSDLFEVVDKQHKLFRRQLQPVRFTPEFEVNRPPEETLTPNHNRVNGNELEALALRTIQNRFGADGVIVNREMQIVLFRGHTSPYIDPAPGNPSFHLLRMIREDLAFKLEGMLARAIQENSSFRETDISLRLENRTRKVNLEVIPLQPVSVPDSFYLVLFEKQPDEEHSEAVAREIQDSDSKAEEFTKQLAEARANLRSLVEEHEVHVEELRAANEEVRSTNEELQSTNEELSAAKEELQSTNEELGTFNQELNTKNASLAALNDDLKNLFNAANLPILMVDSNLCLRRFTPAAESFFDLASADIGRPIADFRSIMEIPQLKELIDQTISDLSISKVTALAKDQRWYTVTIRPYRTVENHIDGAVITFSDIDALKRSYNDAQDAREYAESILDTLWEPLIVLDAELRVERATPGFYRTFQVLKEETEGRLFYDLGKGQWDSKRLRTLLEDVLPKDFSFQDFEIEQSFPKIGFRSMRLNARRIRRRGDGREAILLAIDDVTDRREAAEIRFRRLFEAAKDGILELDGDSGEILDMNPFFLQLCHCSRETLIGKKLWETGLFESHARLRDLVNESLRREIVRFESLGIRARDGKHFEVEMVCNR